MDTMHIIKMPDIGEGIAEVEIVEWHVSVGDNVSEDQVLAEVMTDKASVEIPSPIAGRVVSLGGQLGDVLAVGSELITLQPEGGASESAGGHVSADVGIAETVKVQPAAAEPKSTLEGAPAVSHQKAAPVISHQKALASPSVRQRARHLDIDLQDLADPEGDRLVSHKDLDDFLLSRYTSERTAAPRPPHTERASADIAQVAPAPAEEHANIRINVVGLRRQIARKMQESKQQIPHFSYVEEVDVTDLERLRHSLNERHEGDQERITVLPFIVRAIVLAVQRFPKVNARYDAENEVVTQFGAVHMGIATQTENGLMVPVLHNAQDLDLWESAAGIRSVSAVARRGTARPGDLTGSTLTISSLGVLGGIAATPIINHPEVAIVGVNRIVERPAFQNKQLVSRQMMNLSSSFDHRVVDGMDAAQFIQEVKRLLESPAQLFLPPAP